MVAQPYFLVVNDKRHCDLAIIGPLQTLQSLLAVAFEVSGESIVWMRGVDLRHDGN